MIWLLKVKLLFGAYMNDEWEGDFEIESTDTLDELHYAINEAINFDNDHLYEFFASRTPRGRNRVVFDDENGELFTRTIESVFPLEKGEKLFYLFDYGDHWLFQIQRSRKRPWEADPKMTYPRLVGSTGVVPEQYPAMDW